MKGKRSLPRLPFLAAFLVFVYLPLGRMFANIRGENIRRVFSSSMFAAALKNSLTAATIATAITLILSFALALCIQRTEIRCKGLFTGLFTLPMLIPSISSGMGLVILFGNNGIFTTALGLRSGIYGLRGIVLGSVLYAFPVAFLMLTDVMKYEDGSPYEAASVLGIGKLRQLRDLSLPYLRKPLIAIVFSIFTLIITDYGVPLMIGGKYMTIPVVMYQEVIGRLDFGSGAVYGSILLIPAAAAFVIDLCNRDRGNETFTGSPVRPSREPLKTALAYGVCILTSAFVLLPLLSFLIIGFTAAYPVDLTLTLNNIGKALRLHAGRYLFNSVKIAAGTAALGTAAAFCAAYMTARLRAGGTRLLHLSAITTAAVPGIVLGLSYALTFRGSFLYGTAGLLILANTVHFFASPYLMAYNSLSKLNENLEGVGQTLGIGRLHMIRDVFIPRCRDTILEMFSYFFVNCMMTISAVSFLATPANKPVSLMINQFEAQMQLDCAAIVSLAILAVNLLVKGAVYYRSKKRPGGPFGTAGSLE